MQAQRDRSRPQVRRADSRFRTSTGWSESRSSFSFGPHYDPENVGFSSLLVHNHEIVRPGQGFDTHPHNDAEILTWVLSGALVHQDSQGRNGVVYPGLAQRMSAGSGILHSERNDAYRTDDGFRIAPGRVTEPVDFIQMWVRPDEPGLEPSYAQRELDAGDLASSWMPVASGDHPDAAIKINSSGTTLWATAISAGGHRELPSSYGSSHLYVARGTVRVQTVGRLQPGDAVRSPVAEPLAVSAETDAELLLWELPR